MIIEKCFLCTNYTHVHVSAISEIYKAVYMCVVVVVSVWWMRDRQTDRQRERETKREIERDREKNRQRERQTDRERERLRER